MQMLTEEQVLMRAVAERIVRDAGAVDTAAEVPDAVWAALREAGWMALGVAEHDGGVGGGLVERCILAEELGRGLLGGSWLFNFDLPAQLVAASADSALRTALLGELLRGERSLALADQEPGARGAADTIALRATAQTHGWSLDGAKINVRLGSQVKRVLVSARERDTDELLLAIVALDAPGVHAREFTCTDGARAARLDFRGVALAPEAVLTVGAKDAGLIRARAWDGALVVASAECVGIMKYLVETTASYLKVRRQFGRALAEFQVLRHRMADMALACTRAEALVARTARQFDALEARDARDARRLACATAVQALTGSRIVAEQAVQLHGGVGVSAELPIGRYLRRVLALEAMLGTPEYHLARYEEHA